MNSRIYMALLVPLVLLLVADATAGGAKCGTRQMSGNWLFATAIGRQALGEPFPPGKDITAIGTMDVDRKGVLTGTFDITVQDFGFIPGLTYTGTISVNSDCTGTVTFVTSAGSARTDSIAVVSRNEFFGMSQDPNNLWTYTAKRISGRGDDD